MYKRQDNTLHVNKTGISKSGTVNEDTGVIDWTVTVNGDGANSYVLDMDGMTLTDALTGNHIIIGDVTIAGSSGFTTTVSPQPDGKGFSYTVGSNGESGKQRFTITYQTQIDASELSGVGKYSYCLLYTSQEH